MFMVAVVLMRVKLLSLSRLDDEVPDDPDDDESHGPEQVRPAPCGEQELHHFLAMKLLNRRMTVPATTRA
jgi:hypothetical protein